MPKYVVDVDMVVNQVVFEVEAPTVAEAKKEIEEGGGKKQRDQKLMEKRKVRFVRDITKGKIHSF